MQQVMKQPYYKNKAVKQYPLSLTASLPYYLLFRLFSDVSQDTAVNVQNMSVHCVGSLRCQEHSRTCEFLRIQPTTAGVLAQMNESNG